MSRGLIEARGQGGGPRGSPGRFSAVMSRGLIEASPAGEHGSGDGGFSAVMSRGLIEASAACASAVGSPSKVLRGDEPRPH